MSVPSSMRLRFKQHSSTRKFFRLRYAGGQRGRGEEGKKIFFSPAPFLSCSPAPLLLCILFLSSCATSSPQDMAIPTETIIKEGKVISQDQIWSGSIRISGDVTVLDGATLTIRRGTEVKFTPNPRLPYKLIIKGIIYSEGTIEQPINFISDSVSPKPGDWGGIIISASSLNSKVRYSRFQYHKALVFMSDSIEISDSIIAEGEEAGILCESASPRIVNNLITKNPIGVKCVQNSSPEISNNNIVGNGFGIVVENSSFPKIVKNLISSNRQHAIASYSASSPEIISNNIIQNVGWAVYSGGKLEDNFIQGNNRSGATAIELSTERSSAQYYGVEAVNSPRTLPLSDAGARRR